MQKPFFLMENSSPAPGAGVFPAPLHVFSSEVGSFSSLLKAQAEEMWQCCISKESVWWGRVLTLQNTITS